MTMHASVEKVRNEAVGEGRTTRTASARRVVRDLGTRTACATRSPGRRSQRAFHVKLNLDGMKDLGTRCALLDRRRGAFRWSSRRRIRRIETGAVGGTISIGALACATRSAGREVGGWSRGCGLEWSDARTNAKERAFHVKQPDESAAESPFSFDDTPLARELADLSARRRGAPAEGAPRPAPGGDSELAAGTSEVTPAPHRHGGFFSSAVAPRPRECPDIAPGM